MPIFVIAVVLLLVGATVAVEGSSIIRTALLHNIVWVAITIVVVGGLLLWAL